MSSTNRIAWTYTTDASHGAEGLRVTARKTIVDQAAVGGSAASGGIRPKPAGIKMRGVYCTDNAGHFRLVHAYVEDADILTTGTAVTLDLLGTPTAFFSTGSKVLERVGRQTSQAT